MRSRSALGALAWGGDGRTFAGGSDQNHMSAEESPPNESPPQRPRFQFSLRTLLLLFVVLGSSLAVFGAWGIVVFALVVGLAVYVHHVESFSSLAYLALLVLCLMCVIGLLLPAVESARESSRLASCRNKLHQIALALQLYHQANGCFPPAYIADKYGKPMHSWRVLILPYLEYDSLYKVYDFTEPWNGPKNKKLVGTCLSDYACPSDPSTNASGATATNYVAVVGPNAAWAGEKSRKLGEVDFPGGSSSTILLVEVTNSGIPWAEPRDLSPDSLLAADAKLPALVMGNHPGGRHEEFFFTYEYGSGVHVVLADGSVCRLTTAGLSNEELWKMLQIGGCKDAETRSRVLVEGYVRRPNWPNIAALAVWLLSIGTLLTHAVRSRKTLATPPPSAC